MNGEKARLRKACRERAALLAKEYRQEADRAIRERLTQSEPWRSAAGIFLYVSMWAEPDTRALIGDALRAGKRVYVPLCLPDHVMKAVRIRSLDELRPGVLGIPEPPPENETASSGDLDLAVVPCVSASKTGARLGHGAGYYDRFLSAFPCETVCLCHERMLSGAIPTDERDVRMDRVLTETGFYE